MAIDVFMNMRAQLVTVEREINTMLNYFDSIKQENNKLYEENKMLLGVVDKLENELKMLKENEHRKNDCSGSSTNE